MRNFLASQFKRREWTANAADPTAVVQYRSRFLTLTVSWGVDAKVTVFNRTWRTYDHPIFVRLYNLLESAHEAQFEGYDDAYFRS